MAAKKTRSRATKKSVTKKQDAPQKRSLRQRIVAVWHRLGERRRDFLKRRPHRSFCRTRRRDYRRPLDLPGYWGLTAQTAKLLWAHKWLFLRVTVTYVVVMVLIANLMAEETYVQMREAANIIQEEGLVGGATATLTVFWGVFLGQLTGGVITSSNPSAQAVAGLVTLFTWLTIIWLVRAIIAGKRPKMRDALYNSGGPVVVLTILTIVMLLQLVPAAIAVIVYTAADASGVLAWTPVLMLSGGAVALIVVLSLYWMTSTFFAFIIATLPGVYPLEALRFAGDIVVGRRLRILLRMIWLILMVLAMWAIVLIPVMLLDGALKQWLPALEIVPFVPVAALLLTAMSIVSAAVYIYLFYRKVVNNDDASS